MDFESFAHVPLTDEVLAHIWEGEPGDVNQGGHRFGLGREGKTEFPESWSIEQVAIAVRKTLDQPQSVRTFRQGIILKRLFLELIVEVELRVKKDGTILITAFPLCGDGVFMNVRGQRQQIPLNINNLED